MRFYAFTPGSPGYISAERAIRELPTDPPGEARAWAQDVCGLQEGQRLISRSEASWSRCTVRRSSAGSPG